MVQLIADRRDIDFNLYEIFNVLELCSHEKFKKFDKTAFNLILAEARNFAVKEMLAVYRDGDEIGVQFENGRVKVPKSFHRVHRLYCDNQWTAPASDQKFGGQGLPYIIAGAIKEYMMGANWPLYAYGSMGVGTGRMIRLFGTREQKNTYVKKLYTGKWGGTMLLTEPGAGTDVGALTTTAVKNPDGTYSLTGSKVFITNGDHDLCENIIHPVLARIKGDPIGTKGISVFIVPKFIVRSNGRPGKPNDILCTGIEDKHGLHASATCSMVLGSRGNCIGYLLGKKRMGMEIMFNMMNQSRLWVASQALSYASTAYLHTLDYARNRIQGRDLKDLSNHEAPPIPIIRHPDIKRNLLEMKAYVEGLRSLIYFTLDCMDRSGIETDKNKKERLENLVELLIPITKGYGCERGYEVCLRAMQVYGGAGYLREYPVESITRDCKITSIYKGCTGVQAMDLLGRKLSMKNDSAFWTFVGEIESVIQKASKNKEIVTLGQRLGSVLDRFRKIAVILEKTAKSPDYKTAFAHATPFMEIMGDICLAWMHLRRAIVASTKLNGSPVKKDIEFYRGQIHTARFFIQSVLPVTMGKMNSLADNSSTVVEISESAFGGL